VVRFARHAVKAIAHERDSKALLNWLVTGSLEDPEQIGDKTKRLPEISHPFWWRIENGEHRYPSASIGQGASHNM
jgi:hypothetical protein